MTFKDGCVSLNSTAVTFAEASTNGCQSGTFFADGSVGFVLQVEMTTFFGRSLLKIDEMDLDFEINKIQMVTFPILPI